jgi:putative ABC transport system permease protein
VRLYTLLLGLYPREFRQRFGADLVELFADKRRAAAARGPLALVAFWFRILRDVAVTAIAERCRPSQVSPQRGPLMHGMVNDVRFAFRTMARRPALSAIIVLTVALGIGANTAIFSLVNTVLLRPAPYPDAGRLTMVWEQQLERTDAIRPVRPANFFEWKDRVRAFESIAWSRDGMFALTGAGEPESITGYRFSANMLDVLGVQPAFGRGFTPDDDRPGAPGVVLLSDPLWKRRFAGDPAILGRTLTLNGQPHTVIGVMPPAFKHPQRADLWVPIALTPGQAGSRTNTMLRIVARLRPGVTAEDAKAELMPIYQEMAQRYLNTNKGLTPTVAPMGGIGDAKPLLLILSAGVGFVLLIACAKVANLRLADATARRRELAVRSALGASRFRVIRQMLTESVLLALAGGSLGALLTWWTRDGLVVLFPSNIANLDLPLVERVNVDGTVFLFAFAVSVATGLLFGVLPAWNVSRRNLQGALKEGDRGNAGSRRTHSTLVIAEVALSMVLLAGALLMVQSFVRVQRLQFGFEPERVMTGRVILPTYRYGDESKAEQFTRRVLDKLRQIPGVEAAGTVTYLPLSGWSGGIDFGIEGRPQLTGAERPSASYQAVSEDYFRSMGIPVLSGRAFTPRDDRDAPGVVIVNDALAGKYWPGESAVGRRVLIGGTQPQPFEIVGVVGNVRSAGLEEAIEPEMYLSVWQGGDSLICITLRTSGDPAALAAQMRAAVWSVDPDQPLTYVMPLADLAAESLAFRRAGMTLAAGFGALALVLTAVGIFGVLSYSVSRRTREIGVRVALGATRAEVARLVLREGLRMTGIGVALGLAAALALSQFLASVLYEVKPGDPVTYAAVAVILLTVAAAATLIPARRATAVDPLAALRSD